MTQVAVWARAQLSPKPYNAIRVRARPRETRRNDVTVTIPIVLPNSKVMRCAWNHPFAIRKTHLNRLGPSFMFNLY